MNLAVATEHSGEVHDAHLSDRSSRRIGRRARLDGQLQQLPSPGMARCQQRGGGRSGLHAALHRVRRRRLVLEQRAAEGSHQPDPTQGRDAQDNGRNVRPRLAPFGGVLRPERRGIPQYAATAERNGAGLRDRRHLHRLARSVVAGLPRLFHVLGAQERGRARGAERSEGVSRPPAGSVRRAAAGRLRSVPARLPATRVSEPVPRHGDAGAQLRRTGAAACDQRIAGRSTAAPESAARVPARGNAGAARSRHAAQRDRRRRSDRADQSGGRGVAVSPGAHPFAGAELFRASVARHARRFLRERLGTTPALHDRSLARRGIRPQAAQGR